MLSKTQNRLLALALIGAATRFHAQSPAPNQDGNTAPRLPNFDNMQGRRPYTRPQPGTNGIPALEPTSAAPPAGTQPEPAGVTDAPQSTQSSYTPQPTAPARRASVSYTGGQLAIVASNSSLNQILRDVSRSANIKITGGVAEERVFGKYGPGTLLEVLSALLDGTSSNMMLIQGSSDHASELILSTRTGGPTPPSPNSAAFDTRNDDQAAPPQAMASPGSQSEPSRDVPAGTPPPPASADGGTPPSSSSNTNSTDPSSNGVKTPQQIFDELMKLRQQNQQH
jgi:hypothetical protein